MTDWKPQYKINNVVPICFPKHFLNAGCQGFGFVGWGLILLVQEDGFYRVKLTKIIKDNYFTTPVSVGDVLTVHFESVEGVTPKCSNEPFIFR